MINKQVTLCTLVEFNNPIINSLDYMHENNCNSINISLFERYLKQEIDRVSVVFEKSSNIKSIIDNIKIAYSIKNLKNNNLIIIDDGDNSFMLVNYMIEMFIDLSNSMKINPITDRVLKSHIKELDSLILDSMSYHSYTDDDKKFLMNEIVSFLRRAKQDLDKNKKVIISRSESLSRFFEEENNLNKNKIMKEIVILCDKHLSPFHNFLMNYNKNGFVYKLRKLMYFFSANNLPEENELSRFIITFISYRDDIKNIYDKINNYRRKGAKDLIVYNAFEKEFHNLKEEILKLKDGKKTRNYLDSSDYHESFIFSNLLFISI